ncbi:MAG: GNAT family N-acetyltransferase/peptidase C39 family protein [Candidatus Marinimicrobia bacterium]|nr:GNAT family N-acetyltransferase/peptidase C39 family protein [Candidatus Neomarinimicrobiota bacterium]
MIREATADDLESLVYLENSSFETDKISRRSFRYLLSRANATTFVDEENGKVRAYSIILYNSATSHARLYSLVVGSEYRGLGIGQALLLASEQNAVQNECISMRLEVRRDNATAIRLYQKNGYKQIGILDDYYEDHMGAIHYEKEIVPHLNPEMVKVPFYQQTLDFTCGPAAVMMAMRTLNPNFRLNKTEELRLWRESTTIFMTSGHGGCGPFGLALAVYNRGFDVDIYLKDKNALFVDSVRSQQKKEIIKFVQADFLSEIRKLPIKVHYTPINLQTMEKEFNKGHIPIVLISSYRIYHEKAPHWVVVTGFNERYIYVHDSFVDVKEGESVADSINIPILKKEFGRMSQYGKTTQRAVLIIKNRTAS